VKHSLIDHLRRFGRIEGTQILNPVLYVCGP
jgi:hypothetical protein